MALAPSASLTALSLGQSRAQGRNIPHTVLICNGALSSICFCTEPQKLKSAWVVLHCSSEDSVARQSNSDETQHAAKRINLRNPVCLFYLASISFYLCIRTGTPARFAQNYTGDGAHLWRLETGSADLQTSSWVDYVRI